MLTHDNVSWLRSQIASLPQKKRDAKFRKIGATALYDWQVWMARDSQLPPSGKWLLWLICTGRGWGKTRCASETVRQWVEQHATSNYCLIGPTASACRDVMVEGQSGLLNVFPPHQRPTYEPSKCKLTFWDGSTAHTYSADQPDRLRGPQHGRVWCDEVSVWPKGVEVWQNMMLGLRLSKSPQIIATMTPRRTALAVALLKGALIPSEKTIITRGSSYENTALPETYTSSVISPYENSRFGRSEIFGELLEGVVGSLWSYELLDEHRVDKGPGNLTRAVVAIDPATTVSKDSDETGLVVVGKSADGHAYVLHDGSGRYTPNSWAKRAMELKAKYRADCYVLESNQGGLMGESILRSVDRAGRIVRVHASSSKADRASYAFLLYEQGKVHHVGSGLRMLEDQLATFVPGESASHDDRLDALIWALHELFPSEQPDADYSMFTAENVARFEDYMVRRMGVSPEHFIPPGLRRWPW